MSIAAQSNEKQNKQKKSNITHQNSYQKLAGGCGGQLCLMQVLFAAVSYFDKCIKPNAYEVIVWIQKELIGAKWSSAVLLPYNLTYWHGNKKAEIKQNLKKKKYIHNMHIGNHSVFSN